MKPTNKERKTGSKGSVKPELPVITLLTDFGTADYFVGAMKGAILSVNPRAKIVDITHEIPPQDVETGAFTLLAAYDSFPAGTIHVAVVDPGVGSERWPIIVVAGNRCFVGPDNGIFTYIYDREPAHQTFHITSDKYFRPGLSTTFHGRDIFAPVAAALSNGVKPSAFGPRIDDEVRLTEPLEPLLQKNGKVRGRIIQIDRFGNCVTNITRDFFDVERQPAVLVNGKTIRKLQKFYGEDGAAKRLFVIWGSAGFLEISVNGGSAAEVLGAKRGDAVVLTR